ncbi:TIGR04222 domain-containing membrane protein [Pseudonocardia adelaidensis]|uniref:TIGR04222 domain-containing membrane protein n=1 Tax=Pseudonocardia adelaidensis TaxID=648754 RepID=A0ABP9NEN7_9PSEU
MALAATAETWGIAGSTFLSAYLLIATTVGAGGICARRALAEPGATKPIDDLTDRPHDVAYLAGGGELAVWSALCAMHLRGTLRAADGTVRAVGRLEPAADPLEEAIHDTAATPVGRRRLVFHHSVRPALAALEERLVAGGFLLSDDRRRRIRRVGFWMLGVAALGLLRVLADIAEVRPVGLLVTALLIVTAVAVVQLTLSPRRTRRGNRALAALRDRHRALAPDGEPDWQSRGPAGAALGIGLFGTGALAASAPGLAREIAPQVRATRTSGLAVSGGGDGGGGGGGNRG